MKVTYYGHSCFAVEMHGKTLLFDPFITPNLLASHIDIGKIKADYILPEINRYSDTGSGNAVKLLPKVDSFGGYIKLYTELDRVEGVQSVPSINIVNLYDSSLGYSGNVYDIKAATKAGVIYPSLDPSIFEIKYLNSDIVGKVNSI